MIIHHHDHGEEGNSYKTYLTDLRYSTSIVGITTERLKSGWEESRLKSDKFKSQQNAKEWTCSGQKVNKVNKVYVFKVAVSILLMADHPPSLICTGVILKSSAKKLFVRSCKLF